jgi:TolB protein
MRFRKTALSVFTAAVLVPTTIVGGMTAQATFPGGNGRIVFQRTSPTTGPVQIFSMTKKGTDVEKLTSSPRGADAAAVAPDGRIAFTRCNQHDCDIFKMEADGSNERHVTTSDRNEYDPAWSPDGRWILFTRGSFHGRIYKIKPNGKGVKRLTNGDERMPAWSPDGTKIAFMRDGENGGDIATMDADGGNRKILTGGPAFDFEPNWAPDGNTLLFTRFRSNSEKNTDIYEMTAKGTKVTRLTTFDGYVYSPAYSPNGEKIVFTRAQSQGEDGRIYVMDAGGGSAKVLTGPNKISFGPDWGPAN